VRARTLSYNIIFNFVRVRAPETYNTSKVENGLRSLGRVRVFTSSRKSDTVFVEVVAAAVLVLTLCVRVCMRARGYRVRQNTAEENVVHRRATNTRGRPVKRPEMKTYNTSIVYTIRCYVECHSKRQFNKTPGDFYCIRHTRLHHEKYNIRFLIRENNRIQRNVRFQLNISYGKLSFPDNL